MAKVFVHANSPEGLQRLFAEMLTAGDLDDLLSLYQRGGVFHIEPVVSVAEGLESQLEDLLELDPSLKIETDRVINAGDTALLHSRWTLTGDGAGGGVDQWMGHGTAVVKRQPDGTWRFVILDLHD